MNARAHTSLLGRYDALLLDLDGTVMHGRRPIPGAADGIRTARAAGVQIGFATNNASRTPQQTVEHLAVVGIEARSEEIISSPQIAARLLAEQLDPGANVLIVGSEGLAAEVRAVGLSAVSEDSPDVAAVVQGWSPTLDWPLLAEGAYALGHGALWVATNVDATLPTERGMAPGNGSMVMALRHATGLDPQVAGKPEPAMFAGAAERLGARRPLVVGDRLDTDIEGANRAGVDSLLVLTGVDDADAALHADPVRRPTWILPDMAGLDRALGDAEVEGDSSRCGAVSARWDGQDILVSGDPEQPESHTAVLALLAAHRPDTAFTGAVRKASGERS